MAQRNPSVHPGQFDPDGAPAEENPNRRPKRELETAAGKLELARKEVQMGVVGAKERFDFYLEEYERLRTSTSRM